MDCRHTFPARALFVLLLLLFFCPRPALPQNTIPDEPLTMLRSDPPTVRFTVVHTHIGTYCWGLLDISHDTVTYTSLTQPGHSFTSRRDAMLGAKPWETFGGFQNFARMRVGGKNYALIEVQPRAVREQIKVNSEDNVALAYSADTIVAFINDFDTALADWQAKTQQAAQQKAAAEAAAAAPPAPPHVAAAGLRLTSVPGNAQLYLDDIPRGMTSAAEGRLRLTDVVPGVHRVRVSLAGYRDWTEDVEFRDGAELDLNAPLQRAGPAPFTVADVEQMLRGGISTKRAATLVRERGVDFSLTDDTEHRLRAAGADDELMLTIAKNKK